MVITVLYACNYHCRNKLGLTKNMNSWLIMVTVHLKYLQGLLYVTESSTCAQQYSKNTKHKPLAFLVPI